MYYRSCVVFNHAYYSLALYQRSAFSFGLHATSSEERGCNVIVTFIDLWIVLIRSVWCPIHSIHHGCALMNNEPLALLVHIVVV
jgi:hypothetical protein